MKEKQVETGGPVMFRYFGNVGLERWKPLRQLGLALSHYNQMGGGKNALLQVFTGNATPDIIRSLTIEGACEYKGWVHGEEFYNLLADADVAVHVESFSEEMIRRTRCSISTKIADYLGASKCILAIGPNGLGSMEHIKDSAIVANDINEIDDSIKTIINDYSVRKKYQQKARDLARRCHDIDAISKELRKTILMN